MNYQEALAKWGQKKLELQVPFRPETVEASFDASYDGPGCDTCDFGAESYAFVSFRGTQVNGHKVFRDIDVRGTSVASLIQEILEAGEEVNDGTD